MEPEKNRGLEEFFSFSITIIFRFQCKFCRLLQLLVRFFVWGIMGHTGHRGGF